MGHHFDRQAHPCHTPKILAAIFISLVIGLVSSQPACAISQNGHAPPPTNSAAQDEHPYLDNPEGHFRYGMGDAEFQAALIHDFNERWAAGFRYW
jgi:hypothetical protein